MEHRRRWGAACAVVLLILSLAASASATEPESTDVAPDSISEVMLEDTGLELEDTMLPPPASDAVAEADVMDEAEEDDPPPAPARAAPSP
jgi:hypothetical protein